MREELVDIFNNMIDEFIVSYEEDLTKKDIEIMNRIKKENWEITDREA